ncbi:MAG: hypothetical protein P0Y64_02155 [Candidatus Sphingomonas colombiensis]|nr:hypothetical protein [Sphingomonas sp.]WEK43659.1 MAG: hypothetical protein P0Y64_02155 [Sphingomonas sp.]
MADVDVGQLLVRALTKSATGAGATASFTHVSNADWWSAGIAGLTHEILCVAASSDAFDDWLAHVSDADFPLAGHLVAEIVVAKCSREDGNVVLMMAALTAPL